ncbi:MAG: hypothetical protein OER91_13730 [Gammaproteobacteria bacterium]|nr:hypothetical protein [Gammaproteobacteria bacterium]
MRAISRLLIVVICLSVSGCSINRATGTFDPGKDLVNSDIFYVERFAPDKRELNKTIADGINVRGYTATFGPAGEAPDDATVIVTYVDKWMWDITNYMIELTITFRDPESGAALGSGNSYHTSLTRLSPEEMIEEVLTNIFSADTGEEPAEG